MLGWLSSLVPRKHSTPTDADKAFDIEEWEWIPRQSSPAAAVHSPRAIDEVARRAPFINPLQALKARELKARKMRASGRRMANIQQQQQQRRIASRQQKRRQSAAKTYRGLY
jgi:hypothetical protein